MHWVCFWCWDRTYVATSIFWILRLIIYIRSLTSCPMKNPKLRVNQLIPKLPKHLNLRRGWEKGELKPQWGALICPLFANFCPSNRSLLTLLLNPNPQLQNPLQNPQENLFELLHKALPNLWNPLNKNPFWSRKLVPQLKVHLSRRQNQLLLSRGRPWSLLPNQNLKRKTTAWKTTLPALVSNRPASIKQAPKQGPFEKEDEEPKSKKAKPSTLPSLNLAKFL